MSSRITEKIVRDCEIKEIRYDIRDSGCQGLFLRIEPSGNKTYYLNYRNAEKQRLTVKLGASSLLSPSQAREKAQVILATIATTGTDPRIRSEHKEITLQELAFAYQDCHSSTYVKKTVESAFKKILDLQIKDIKSIEIQRWRKAQNNILSTTINRKITALNALLNWGVSSKLITENPIKGLKRLKENDSTPITRYLSDAERVRLTEALKTAPEYLRNIVLIALNTGIRRGALFGLKWADINFDEKTMTLRSETAKSGKSAILPLNKTALETFKNIKQDGEYVFPSPVSGTKFNNIKRAWHTILSKADIKDFRFHDLRHDFASRLVMSGVDLNTVRELMTHSDIKMTLRYAHLAPEKKKYAVDLLD